MGAKDPPSDEDQFLEGFARAGESFLRAAAGQDKKPVFLDRPAQRALVTPPVKGADIVVPEHVDPASPESRDQARAGIDTAAAWLAHHDHVIHNAHRPADRKTAQVFDMLEKARTDALLSRTLPGVAHNFSAAIDQYIKNEGETGSEPEKAMNAAYMAAHEAFGGAPLSPEAREFVRRHLRPVMDEIPDPPEEPGDPDEGSDQTPSDKTPSSDGLQQLAQLIGDQEKFAQQAARVAQDLQSALDMAGEESESDAPQMPDGPPKQGLGKPGPAAPTQQSVRDLFSKGKKGDGQGEGSGEALDLETIDESYRIFTKEFDEVVPAASLVSPGRRKLLRKEMDEELQPYRLLVNKLAVRLQRRLMAQQRRSWLFDREDGQLDPARLSRIVVDPFEPLAFREETEALFKNTAVTILVDNSGSMREYNKIRLAATTADILSRALERAGVPNEVLGFTTVKDGRSIEKWYAQGRPSNAGRIDTLRHIVYKNFNQPWRRAKDDIAVMLEDGVLGYNIDGESLLWAFNRLARRPEPRKILIVVSDGDPSSQPAGRAALFANHLKLVTRYIEEKTPIELAAVGLMTDATRYYKNAVMVRSGEALGSVLLDKLEDLFVDPTRTHRHTRSGPGFGI